MIYRQWLIRNLKFKPTVRLERKKYGIEIAVWFNKVYDMTTQLASKTNVWYLGLTEQLLTFCCNLILLCPRWYHQGQEHNNKKASQKH